MPVSDIHTSDTRCTILRVGRRRQAEAAIVRGDGGAEQAQGLHLLDHVVRIDVGMLQRMHVRAHVALQPSADAVEDLVVVFGRIAKHARRGRCNHLGGFLLGRDYWGLWADVQKAMISHFLQH